MKNVTNKIGKKVKKIRMINYLNKQTAFQIGAMWKACGYKVLSTCTDAK